MNIAVIDIGTNTFDLLISRTIEGGRPLELHNSKFSVRLGAGGILEKILQKDSMQRAIATLKDFKKIIQDHNCSRIYAFATSAVRDAVNKYEFTSLVKQETGIEVQVISGDKEAELIYLGVRNALDLGHRNSLIMDIGGGSIEFIIADKNDIFWQASYNLGVARLIEKFKISDPITIQEQQDIETYLKSELGGLFEIAGRLPVDTLVGSSGSFDTFAEVIVNRFHSPDILLDKTEYTFNIEEYYETHEQLVLSSLEDRKKIAGIIEMRLDMIVMSSIITNFILRQLDISKMRLSTFSMKEGVLWEAFNNYYSGPAGEDKQ